MMTDRSRGDRYLPPLPTVDERVRVREHSDALSDYWGQVGRVVDTSPGAPLGRAPSAIVAFPPDGCVDRFYADELDVYDPSDPDRDIPWQLWANNLDWLAANVRVPNANWCGTGPSLVELARTNWPAFSEPLSHGGARRAFEPLPSCPPGDMHWLVLGARALARWRLRSCDAGYASSDDFRLVTGEFTDHGHIASARMVYVAPRQYIGVVVPDRLKLPPFRCQLLGWRLNDEQAKGLGDHR